MLRGVALALTVLTGFSGLVYEVTWEKVLATLLGSHSEATAALLVGFAGTAWPRCGQDGPEQHERCRRALVRTQSRLGDLGLTGAGAAGDS